MSDKRRHRGMPADDMVLGRSLRNFGTCAVSDVTSAKEVHEQQSGAWVEDPKLKVVIVEDSAMIRARLAEALTEIPNLEIVGQAETEQEAVALLRNIAWDATVLDLQLKKGTGLGVLKALAETHRTNNRKVIVFTNYAFPQ